MTASPGWYPDHLDRRSVRWWDGAEWTSATLDLDAESLHVNPPPNWPISSDVELLDPEWRPDPAWGPAPDDWPMFVDSTGNPPPPPPLATRRTRYLANAALGFGFVSYLLAAVSFLAVVTEDDVGQTRPSDWVVVFLVASISAALGVLALWSGRPAPRPVRRNAWFGIIAFGTTVFAPLLARMLAPGTPI